MSRDWVQNNGAIEVCSAERCFHCPNMAARHPFQASKKWLFLPISPKLVNREEHHGVSINKSYSTAFELINLNQNHPRDG